MERSSTQFGIAFSSPSGNRFFSLYPSGKID
jgi:hypothetical protein